MPSYSYSAPLHRLPPTPPEDSLPSYNTAMGAMTYQQNGYPPHMQGPRQDERSCGYNEYYPQVTQPLQPVPAAPMYQQYYNTGAASAPPNAPPNVPLNPAFYQPMMGPILPPIRNYAPAHPVMVDQPAPQNHRDNRDRARKDQKEDKPVGGVSAKLDYDMEDMTDFVAETSQAMYDLLYCPSVCLADIDIAGSAQTNRPIPSGFRKWVHQVLSATRLPSSTILLAFEYLAEHMRTIQTTLPANAEGSEAELHRLLTTALILGSKFLDDNTFINKSWAEVSGIDVATLNYMERSWLSEIKFRLHRDPNTPHGFQSFYARWKSFEQRSRNARNKPTINAGPPAQPSQHLYSPAMQGYGPMSPRDAVAAKSQSSYATPSFGRYDPYGAPRSTDTSPPSAPHTSPQTPEFYGHQTPWASLNGNFGFRPHPSSYPANSQPIQAVAQVAAQPPFMSMGYPPPAPVYASGHGVDCMCVPCTRRYMMAPHFGFPQPVAG